MWEARVMEDWVLYPQQPLYEDPILNFGLLDGKML